ncbi:MAG: hydroxyphenylacetyl-CoA thioesterase PaaI [Pseudomonadota bacterium]|nr:hydroxyphenylacetyl-CoA thioesterase PaaI [Pseudomonadota bacterium]
MNDTQNSLSIAKTCSEHMHRDDYCSRMLGMVLDDASPGYARLSMLIRDDMVNGHGNCHGGMIFTLADTAFAHACNTRNQVSVAVSCQIEFLVAVKTGERLTATAAEQFLGGRNGVYDVSVNLADGSCVALFRGKSRAIGETLLGSNREQTT